MIKVVGPEEASNLFQGEGDMDLLYGDLTLSVFRNFLKLIQHKLKLKINSVTFRYFRWSFRGIWDVLA